MNTKFIKWSACAVLLTTISYAQEQDSLKVNSLNEVVVSDTKFAQSKEKSGKIIEKITHYSFLILSISMSCKLLRVI